MEIEEQNKELQNTEIMKRKSTTNTQITKSEVPELDGRVMGASHNLWILQTRWT